MGFHEYASFIIIGSSVNYKEEPTKKKSMLPLIVVTLLTLF